MMKPQYIIQINKFLLRVMSNFTENVGRNVEKEISTKIRTKSQLIAFRKQRALESSQYFANNQISIASKPQHYDTKKPVLISFTENPQFLAKRIKRQQDLENFSSKFSIVKHGIHNQSLPKFSEHLDRLKINHIPVPVLPTPKTQKISKQVLKEPEIQKPNESWTWLNESSDIVEFHELKRSVKIQQENFRNKRENIYSEYFTKLIKEKEIKDKLVHAIKKKHNLLIQNRINSSFKLDETIHKSSEVRTTGFITNIFKDLY